MITLLCKPILGDSFVDSSAVPKGNLRNPGESWRGLAPVRGRAENSSRPASTAHRAPDAIELASVPLRFGSPQSGIQTEAVGGNLRHTPQALSSGSWYSGIFESLTQLKSLWTSHSKGFFVDRECAVQRRACRGAFALFLHVVILREWLREAAGRHQPRMILMVGFSMGADMGFELLLGPTDEPGPAVDAFLALECNLSLETCFASQVLAALAPDRPEISMAELRRLGDTAGSLDEWLNIQEYLVRVLRKFQGDIGVLQRAAADIVRRFREEPGFEVFARWFQGARKRVRVLRLVFSNDAGSRAALARLRLENLDRRILGEEFPESLIRVRANADHFDLMSAEHVLEQVNELVAQQQASLPRDSNS